MTRRDLPAPYESPWRQLGRDLRAVLASSRLKLRELWRRNGEADLPRPSFWPEGLAPLFWPLVLAAVLLTAVAIAWLQASTLNGASSSEGVVIPAPAPTAGSAPETRGDITPVPALDATPEDEATDPRESPMEFPVASAGEYADEAPEETQQEAPPGGLQESLQEAPEGEAAGGTSVEEAQADPLVEAFGAVDPQRLISAILPRPDGRTLALTLRPAFAAEAAAARLERAEDWRRQAEALGYERLELSDARGGLLGRTALVGSGMILLEPPQPP